MPRLMHTRFPRKTPGRRAYLQGRPLFSIHIPHTRHAVTYSFRSARSIQLRRTLRLSDVNKSHLL
jgi:hypothetical protein